MTGLADAVLPPVIVFFASVVVKRTGVLTAEDGGSLLRVVFYLGNPPLLFLAVVKVDLDAELFRLCLLPPAIIGVSLLAVLVLRWSALRHLDARTFGPFLTGVVVMNLSFLLPFVQQTAGAEGLARLAIIITFNGIVIYSLVYTVVVWVANDTPDLPFMAKKVLLAPPLWGLLAAFAVKLADVNPPSIVIGSFDLAARLVATAVLVALGLKFELRVQWPRLLVLALALRFGLGLAVGVAFVTVMGLRGIDANIAIFASVAPVGFISITFAELERLDVSFAASQVSVGLLVTMVASPLTVQLLL